MNGRIVQYQDLIHVPDGETGGKLVDVRAYDASLLAEYQKLDMLPYVGERILVRDSVASKLAAVNSSLPGGFLLKVVYGYRHPDIQQMYFDRKRTLLRRENPLLSEQELDGLTHNFVAVPAVAGHATGGAVDVTIVDRERNELDMGTAIADFSEPAKIKTYAPGLTQAQIENRKSLHDAMLKEDFAPFYGEWWHFSYGDREWAFFYGKESSLYSKIDYKI